MSISSHENLFQNTSKPRGNSSTAQQELRRPLRRPLHRGYAGQLIEPMEALIDLAGVSEVSCCMVYNTMCSTSA
jgi:hypothetical protein